MNPEASTADERFGDAQEISDQGERVTHLIPDATYYAHLSIYDFAARFCKGAVVLDAGSGAGYGSAFLADRGARHVSGIDASGKAVAFSRHHFRRPNLTYQEMDLERIDGFPPGHFDLIYSSNTLEHVPRVAEFLRHAWRLLKPTGTLLLAVPPITDDRLQYLNIINPYHVNIWSPRQWAHALGLYFEEVAPFLHGVEKSGADFRPEHFVASYPLTEKSFVFEPGTIKAMYRKFTLTAIFVVRRPRAATEVPVADAPLSFVDESFTRPPGHIDPEIRRRFKKYFDMPTPPFIRPTRAARLKSKLKWVVKGVLSTVSRGHRRG